MTTEKRTTFERFRHGYRATALFLLNTIVAVVVLNLFLGAAYWAKDTLSSVESAAAANELFRDDGRPIQNGKRNAVQMAWIDYTAYGDASPQHVGQVLDEFYEMEQLGFVYQPWVQFVESPYRGNLVNVDVDERGFPIRRTIDLPRDSAAAVVRIFALGGSTTFGYYVSDEQTWPSHLSRILNDRADALGLAFDVEVINYGRGYFYPSQEAVLLLDLLRSGHRPSLVLFMDGVNWGWTKDLPQFSPEVSKAFIERQHGEDLAAGQILNEFRAVPMVRFAFSVNRLLDGSPDRAVTLRVVPDSTWGHRIRVAVNGFKQSRALSEAACGLYGCRTLFFLQPNALHEYNLELYRRKLPEGFTSRLAPTDSLYRELKQSEDYIDLSGLFREWGADRKAIIDDLHYAPHFDRFLAERVAAHIDLEDLPVFDRVIDEEAATGDVRSVVTADGVIGG